MTRNYNNNNNNSSNDKNNSMPVATGTMLLTIETEIGSSIMYWQKRIKFIVEFVARIVRSCGLRCVIFGVAAHTCTAAHIYTHTISQQPARREEIAARKIMHHSSESMTTVSRIYLLPCFIRRHILLLLLLMLLAVAADRSQWNV